MNEATFKIGPVPEFEALNETIGVAQLVTPNENPLAPLKANRTIRRAIAKAKRLQDKRQLRHDVKKSIAVRMREEEKRVRLCPACGLDFLGTKERCQCNVITIDLFKYLNRMERSM